MKKIDGVNEEEDSTNNVCALALVAHKTLSVKLDVIEDNKQTIKGLKQVI